MAIQIGIVKVLIGTVTATSADGSTRNLQVGDSVYADELVSTGTGGAVELEFADGSVMDLGRDSQALLDNAVFNPEALAETAAVAESDADAIQAAILAGADPTQVTEATAAGAGTQSEGNEGHQPVVIDYLAPRVTPDSGFDTTGISVAFPEIIEALQAPEEPVALEEPQSEIIIDVTLSSAIDQESRGVYENETITYIATLNQTSQGDISVALSNGAVIVISAGSLTGFVTVPAQGDDPYIDGELLTVSITGVTGGAGEGLTFNSTPVEVQIFDTIDNTTLTLNDVTVNESTGTATMGATLSAAPTNGDVVFTLSNGATITFTTAYVAGTTVQSTAFAIQGDDVYVDGEIYEVSAVSYTGGAEFENLVYTDKATVTIDDTINATTVTLDDINVTEVGTITYTASVDNAPQGAFSVTLNNGVVINFVDGALTGSSAPQAAQGDDVYNDGRSYSISISSTSGGNYEAVNTGSTATVTITDTIDTVTATLTTDVSEISENGGSITYTVTLTGTPGAIAPDNDLVFTLTNPDGSGTAITVTVAAGATFGQTIVNYTDEQITNQASLDNSIASYTGGSEYEDLQTAGSTSVDVDYAPIISGLTSKLDGGDLTVDEDDLLNGSDTSKESTTQTGTFTITAQDGVSSLTVGGHAVITSGVFSVTSFVTVLGNTLAFTGFNPLTGEVTYT